MSPKRVTLIDEDRDLLELFIAVLEEDGYEVEAFTDAMPGIEELIASKPDLVIVDLRLGGDQEQLSGSQIIHSARTSPELRDVPIVVASAATDLLTEKWPGLMQRGDVHKLEKPFDLDTFERVIQTALGLGHGEMGTDDADGRRIRPGERAS